jgi:pilus assembly protein CpaE
MTSEAINTSNNVESHKVDSLLPPAKIHLFSEDLETLSLFDALSEDWRFGRIHTAIRGNNLDDAIEYYSRRKSPTLIVIQTNTIEDAFQKRLEDLAGVCDEGTAAVIVGPVNDVQLYRHLINIGISDYLVEPLRTEDLVSSVANALQDLVGAVNSQLLALVGVKGGVGTTCVTSMMGDILSGSFQQKTLVLDAAGANSTLWNNFGFSPSGSLIEAALAVADQDMEIFKRLIVKKSDYLHVLNSGTENILDKPVAVEAYEMLLDYCLSIYPNVIVDTSGAPVAIKKVVLARANSIAVVTTPRVPDLSLTKLMLKAIKSIPGGHNKNPYVILNKSGMSKSHEIGAKDICEALDISEIIELPWDTNMFAKAENSGEALSTQKNFSVYQKKLYGVLLAMFNVKIHSDNDDAKTTSSIGFFNTLLNRVKGN